MEEHWVVFPSDLDGKFTLFTVDAGYRDDAPLGSHSVCQWVMAKWGEGFPDAEQADRLESLEEWLVPFVEGRMGAFVGRTTSISGHRQFFFYVPENLADAISEGVVEREFGFDLTIDGRDDAEWEVYLEFLYPTPLDWQRISNQSVLRSLAEHGDVHEIARVVDHYAYFEDQASQVAFSAFVQQVGYEVAALDETENGHFSIHFTHESPVTLDVIDELAISLFIKADEFGGRYDGWGSPVVRQEPPD